MSSYAHQQLHTAYFSISLAKAIGYYKDPEFELKQYDEAMTQLRQQLEPVQPVIEVQLMDSGFSCTPLHDKLKHVNFMQEYFSPSGGRAKSIDYPAIIHANVRKVMTDIAFATVPSHRALKAFYKKIEEAPPPAIEGKHMLATGRHVHAQTTELVYDKRYREQVKALLQQIVEVVEELLKTQQLIPYNPELPHYRQRTDAVYMKNDEQLLETEKVQGPVTVSLPLGTWFDVRVALATLPPANTLHSMHGPLKKTLQQQFS